MASVYCDDDMKYLDELPERCKVNYSNVTLKGEELFRHLSSCGLEAMILKIRHPDLPVIMDIPNITVSDADCTYSKIRQLEVHDKVNLSLACSLRGIIGKDPETISDNKIRRTAWKNAEKLWNTTKDYSQNCSREEFKDFGVEDYVNGMVEQNECLIIEMIRNSAIPRELEQEDESDEEGTDAEESTVEEDKEGKDAMEVKTSTECDDKKRGYIIVPIFVKLGPVKNQFVNYFFVKPK